jgi:hypothetical protein
MKSMRWAEHVACMGEMKNAYNILVVKFEGKRPLGRPRCRWKNRSYRSSEKSVDWMYLAQDSDQ